MNNYFNLEIKDCIPINYANIKINRINVIGGVNASGKSTVSKVLYSFLRPNILAKESVLNYVISDINEIIKCSNKIVISKNRDKLNEIIENDSLNKEILKENGINLLNSFTVEEDALKIIKTYKIAQDNILDYINTSDNPELFDESDLMLYPNKFFIIDSLTKLILGDDEGYGYLMLTEKLLIDESAYKKGFFKIYGDSFEYKIENKTPNTFNLYNNCYSYYGTMNKFSDVLYIDSISIFDLFSKNGLLYHNMEMIDYLKGDLNEFSINPDFGLNDDISDLYPIDDKTRSLLEKFDKLVDGKFGRLFDNVEYKHEEDIMPITGNYLSSGFKQLAIIRLLLATNKLKENTFLIIDEPEVNLHPEWQIKFAEILVLLAKELDVTLYLNSHSPIFIEAISLYSQYYDLIDETNFYLTVKQKNNMYNFKKIDSKDMGEVYENLTKPYDELDELKAKILFKE